MCVETAACQARVFGAMLCMIGSPGNSHPHWVHLEREREKPELLESGGVEDVRF